MFASNQKFEISGDMSQLKNVLSFALEHSRHIKDLTKDEQDRGCKLVFQITKSGKYCIGWGFKEIPKYWSEYQFDFDISIVAQIIVQHLNKLKAPESGYEWADGSTSEGFIVKSIEETFGDDTDIKNAFYGIVYFEPYTNFYSK